MLSCISRLRCSTNGPQSCPPLDALQPAARPVMQGAAVPHHGAPMWRMLPSTNCCMRQKSCCAASRNPSAIHSTAGCVPQTGSAGAAPVTAYCQVQRATAAGMLSDCACPHRAQQCCSYRTTAMHECIAFRAHCIPAWLQRFKTAQCSSSSSNSRQVQRVCTILLEQHCR
jgi:hypothetical protein